MLQNVAFLYININVVNIIKIYLYTKVNSMLQLDIGYEKEYNKVDIYT